MEDSKKIDKKDNNLELHDTLCCICYNDKLTLFLNCNHIICLECITNIKKPGCPLCRVELSYLPKKIINIINNNDNTTLTSNNTSSYLSLLHNIVPMSLSSPNNLRYSLLPTTTNFSPLLPTTTNFTHTSLINNDLLLYEQYFNELAFIDIDDIIHYGFINENIEEGLGREENDNNDRANGSDRTNDNYRYFDRANDSTNGSDRTNGSDSTNGSDRSDRTNDEDSL